MIKFPSIEQYRHVIASVKHRIYYNGKDENGDVQYDKTRQLPTLNFIGSVKLHGTNAAIQYDADGSYTFQSRKNQITPEQDNAGFARYMTEEVGHDIIMNLRKMIFLDYDLDKTDDRKITIFGEWCGGNIQGGVALNQLPKMFVVFAIRIGEGDYGSWLNLERAKCIKHENVRIYNIADFPMWEMKIDFNDPEASKQKLIDLTMAVEEECPVGKQLGASGIGEGIVWRCDDVGFLSSDYWFKIKGVKHGNKKEKTIAEVDVEKLNSVNEFIEATVTENRLLQGLDHLREMNKEVNEKSTGIFIKWVFEDVMKEESDTMEASGLEKKDISKAVSIKARTWFFDKLEEMS
jgi:hypothetical protein